MQIWYSWNTIVLRHLSDQIAQDGQNEIAGANVEPQVWMAMLCNGSKSCTPKIGQFSLQVVKCLGSLFLIHILFLRYIA